MIIATIEPTRPLAGDREVSSKRGMPAVVKSKATQEDPAVLLCGSPPVRLALPWKNVHWVVVVRGDAPVTPPTLSHSVGDFTRLGTDTAGLFTVKATVALSSLEKTKEFTWTVRFIRISAASPTETDIDNKGSGSFSQREGCIAILAHFKAKIPVTLSGSDDAPSCYDRVTTGILQNMHWTHGQTLYGIYCTRGTGTICGHLFEPLPRAVSPNLDCGNVDNFPFYNETVKKQGNQRSHEFDDGPGIVIPLLYKPGSAPGTWIENPDQSFFVLRKVAGSVSFVSAAAACSQHAPHTYVIAGYIRWQLVLNQRIDEIPVDEYKKYVAMNLSQFLKTPEQPHGTVRDPNGSPDVFFAPPREAQVAGIESFGPVATKTDKLYRWVSKSGNLDAWQGSRSTPSAQGQRRGFTLGSRKNK